MPVETKPVTPAPAAAAANAEVYQFVAGVEASSRSGYGKDSYVYAASMGGVRLLEDAAVVSAPWVARTAPLDGFNGWVDFRVAASDIGHTVYLLDQQRLFVSWDGCRTWATMPLPEPCGAGALAVGDTADDVFLVTSRIREIHIHRSRDGGRSWTLIAQTETVLNLQRRGRGRLWYARGKLFLLANDGVARIDLAEPTPLWVFRPREVGPDCWVGALAVSADHPYLAASASDPDHRIYFSPDDGQSWSSIEPDGDLAVDGMAFGGATLFVKTGPDSGGGQAPARLLATPDQGSHWFDVADDTARRLMIEEPANFVIRREGLAVACGRLVLTSFDRAVSVRLADIAAAIAKAGMVDATGIEPVTPSV